MSDGAPTLDQPKGARPRLLDLFCGAGGCSVGYKRAGFGVVGVDIAPQKNYPFEFIQADALEILSFYNLSADADCLRFDAIHASPPCQAYSSITRLGKTAGDGASDLVAETRRLLQATGLPYVIENVEGAPLIDPTMICGSSLGLAVRRHRLFETNFPLLVPSCAHGSQRRAVAVYGDHPQKTDRSPWRAETLAQGQAAMGIDWMPWQSLTQAIPPAYTELIGAQLLDHLRVKAAA